MFQVTQSLKTGHTDVSCVPMPVRRHNSLLFRPSVSLISAGTARILLYLGRANLFEKVRLQLDQLEKMRIWELLKSVNFRKMRAYGWPTFKRMSLWRQNKGAQEMAAAFVDAIRVGGLSPIPLDELIEVSRTTLQAASQ
jgi:hypothetical protein